MVLGRCYGFFTLGKELFSDVGDRLQTTSRSRLGQEHFVCIRPLFEAGSQSSDFYGFSNLDICSHHHDLCNDRVFRLPASQHGYVYSSGQIPRRKTHPANWYHVPARAMLPCVHLYSYVDSADSQTNSSQLGRHGYLRRTAA